MINNKTIIFFDGECMLCNRLIIFLLKRNKKGQFYFSQISSKTYREVKQKYEIDEKIDSIIVFQESTIFYKSSAVFTIINQIGGIWKILLIFKILSTKINNYLYDFLARNRYQIFGKTTCYIPSEEERSYFLP